MSTFSGWNQKMVDEYNSHKSAEEPILRSSSTLTWKPSKDEQELNKTEAEYLFNLRSMRYPFIGIKSITLKIGDDCRYTPDFVTYSIDRGICLHEVKGFMRDDALVKMKVVARMFPFWRLLLARKVKGAWSVTEVDP